MTNCKQGVHHRHQWRSVPCSREAVTPAGYCKQHDPELKKAAEAKRGPTKWQREMAAQEQLRSAARKWAMVEELCRSYDEQQPPINAIQFINTIRNIMRGP